MIVDIENFKSLQSMIARVTEGWFSAEEIYSNLKANRKTDSFAFWGESSQLLRDVASTIRQSPEEFTRTWNQRCISHAIKIMGYHCTRHSDKRAFTEKGILPLSEETIKFFEEENQTSEARRMWEYRFKKSPGPCFLLSYTYAKNPDEHSFFEGPEILLICTGRHVDVDPKKSVPLLIHCAIPYSIIPDLDDYFAYCILKAYFNFIDPEDESNNMFKGASIDLKGKILNPYHIVRIEEISTII